MFFRIITVVFLCVPFSASAESALPWLGKQERQEFVAPPAKFFPLNPVEHTRSGPPVTYLANPSPAPVPRSVSKTMSMDEEQARQLLSIYPVQN